MLIPTNFNDPQHTHSSIVVIIRIDEQCMCMYVKVRNLCGLMCSVLYLDTANAVSVREYLKTSLIAVRSLSV